MATVLGKRKKPSPAATTAAGDADTSNDSATIQDIFRQHFEAQFKPLTGVPKKKKTKTTKTRMEVEDRGLTDSESDSEQNREGESEDADDWSGLSSDGDDDDKAATAKPAPQPIVQVVDYSTAAANDSPDVAMTKHERKLYLSSHPPSSFDDAEAAAGRSGKKTSAKDKEYKDAPDLLANDLALQRLISESHLLSGHFALPASSSSSSSPSSASFATAASDMSAVAAIAGSSFHSQALFSAGRLRQRATDLRIQAVANKARGEAGWGGGGGGGGSGKKGGSAGSGITVSRPSDSIFTQAKMPMAMRKGIVAAATSREARRRQEARESGIVLERPAVAAAQHKAKGSSSKRLRPIDAPAVGRLRGSELRLRDRDVREIEGPRKTFGHKKKKRR